MKNLITCLVVSLLSGAAFAYNNSRGSTLDYTNADWCGTINTPENQRRMQRMLDDGTWEKYRLGGTKGNQRGGNIVNITAHIVRYDNGTGGLPEESFDAHVAKLNENVAATGLTFCVQAFVYHDDSSIAEIVYGDDPPTAGMVANTMNVYCVPVLIGAGGFASYPPGLTFCIENTYMGPAWLVNSVFSHEAGHYFNLRHTFNGTADGSNPECVDGSNCSTAGDLICDTPADDNGGFDGHTTCNYTGTALDQCGSGLPYDPIPTNIMSYMCLKTYTVEQLNVFLATANNERSNHLSMTCDSQPPQIGACCLNENCSVMPVSDCVAFGGSFLGDGSNCQDKPCINSILNVPGDFPTIQAAVDAAINGDEILVMPGTYVGTGEEVVNLLGKAVWLHSSAGQGVTIIDGEGMRRGIYCGNGETLNTVIEGFTITNGNSYSGSGMYNYSSNPTLTNCTFEYNTANNSGGGMYNQHNSSPTLTNCTFTGNTAGKGGGGGMSNYGSGSPTLTNCTFTNNSANYGGGMSNYDNSTTLTDCTFTNNTANSNGGGIYNYFSSPTLTNCTFTNNNTEMFRGGGMYNYGKSSPTLTNCTFTNNTATYSYGGGMSNYESSPTLTNCTFENNIAIYGGGMDNNNYSDPTLTDCTFTNNAANSNGGGIYSLTYSNPTLTDTTICGNTPNQIYGDWTDYGGNTVADVCPVDCPDINGDGYVDVSDLLTIIDQWGLTDSPADVNDDGIVDVADLLMVVGNWGPCE